ncbi:MAG: Ig-like domain-containing protein [Patescibacteria group bacterium]|nr:Ig-like domain-containing protein [Patescibacteria group bacterium]
MENLNKKTLLRVFLGLIFIQVSVLLAISANFLLAQTGSEDIEITVSENGNRKDFQAVSNMPLENIMFYFDNLNDSTSSLQLSGIPTNTTNLTSWSLNLADNSLINNVDYNFYATGYYEGTSYRSINDILIPINSDNEITPEITIRTEDNQTVLQGTEHFYADISTGHSLNDLIFHLGDHSFHGGVSPDLSNWSATQDTSILPDGEYNFYAEGLYNDILYVSQNNIFITIDNYNNTLDNSSESTNSDSNSSNSITTNSSIEITVSENGNRKDFQAVSNIPLENIMFYFDNLNDSTSSLQLSGIPTNTTNLTSWSLNLADNSLINNVDYNFYATGSYEETSYRSINDILIPAQNIEPTIEDNTLREPLVLTFVERFESPLSGDQQISISSNQEINSCVLSTFGSRLERFLMIKDSPTKYHIILHTKNFPNGNYTIKATAKNDIEMVDVRLDIKIENLITTIAQPTIEPSTIESQPITETYPITETKPVNETKPADETASPATYDASTHPETFIIELPLECRERSLLTLEECQKYMSIPFECKEQNILNSEECKKYMTESFMPSECKEAGITTKEECDYLLRSTYASSENFSAIEVAPSFTIQTEKELTNECKEQEITSFEECEKYMILISMPEECRQVNVTDPDECKQIMFRKYAPEECKQAQIFNSEECEKYMFEKYAPDDCQKVGILNPEACKKYMFEKYGEEGNIPAEKFPIECIEVNVKTIEECEKVMQKIYMPKECLNEGLESEQECETYLQQKYMSKECLEAGAKNRQECDEVMFKKFGHPECKIAGIENERECEEFIFNKYAPKINCANTENWQCKNSIIERHLGDLTAKQNIYNKINERKSKIVGKSMQIKYFETEISDEVKIIPIIKKDLGIKIIATSESIVLNEKDSLIQTAPIAFMIDSDEDGLPDDLEKRIGTDPNKANTDNDGYKDGEEVKNGYNPFGDGNLKNELSPIDEAILQNKSLGHPKTEGEETKDLVIKNITNTVNEQTGDTKGYTLSGKSEPNSTIALYIYSDLPLVITTKTDKYGNWEYELSESLTEGEHEVYVTINDNTGKVVKKSKPLNFFIKEASAVSVKDFVSIAKASPKEPRESETSIYYYILITLFMTIIGISLFVAVIINKKKNQPLQ